MDNQGGELLLTKSHYDNFKLALYCPAPDLHIISEEKLERDLNFMEKHLKISKVYVENHRGATSLSKERLLELKGFFERRGIEVAGGITPTLPASYRPGYSRLFGSICYTDTDSRAKFQEQVETAASVFDEIIFDDFFFTNCACDYCLELKGNRTWEQFRLELMVDVSENLIRIPAKAINPNVKLVIKYPNWIESYQASGYNTEAQPLIFDGIYTGTETRNPANSQQRIPRYASYSLLRWMEHLKPGANGGGWFDSLDCTFVDYYLEQANLTVFGKAKELALFCYGLLKDSVYVPALGFQLDKLDAVAAEIGNPIGLKVYDPHHARGEDHLVNYLGMLGLPLEPSPHFPEAGQDPIVLVTAASAKDEEVLGKMKKFLQLGGQIVMTSGFVEAMQGRGIEHLTTLRPNGKKMTIHRYGALTDSCTFRDFSDGEAILFPVLDYSTNGTWQRIVGFNGDNNIPILMYDHYGKGTLFTFVIPDNFADLAKLPAAVLDELRNVLSGFLPCRLEGKDSASLFLYDNDTLVLESFRTDPQQWRISVPSGSTLEPLAGARQVQFHRRDDKAGRDFFEVRLNPSSYATYRIIPTVREE
jgi:hypothetical protein